MRFRRSGYRVEIFVLGPKRFFWKSSMDDLKGDAFAGLHVARHLLINTLFQARKQLVQTFGFEGHDQNGIDKSHSSA